MNNHLSTVNKKMLESLKSLTIIGREWMDTYGNTYHSTLLSINNEPFTLLPITYGGSDQYIQTAVNYLKEKNLLPNQFISIYDLKYHFHIKTLYTVSTVTTKKQLKRWY